LGDGVSDGNSALVTVDGTNVERGVLVGSFWQPTNMNTRMTVSPIAVFINSFQPVY
jgi:hypothetical protein